MDDLQMTSEKNDREMIRREHLWPNMRLPLKRNLQTGYGLECAYLMTGEREDGTVVLYKGNIFEQLGRAEQVHYKSVDALLSDGWVVD